MTKQYNGHPNPHFEQSPAICGSIRYRCRSSTSDTLIQANTTPGAPGAGKGTLCTYLAENFNLGHYSIGDDLRRYARDYPGDPLTARIKDRLAYQGFLSSADLNFFLDKALYYALKQAVPTPRGLIFDGYPRSMDVVSSDDAWIQTTLPKVLGHFCLTPPFVKGKSTPKPDVVLFLDVAKETAKLRYLTRGRDKSDDGEKFERRYAEFEKRTEPVVEEFRKRGVLITVGSCDFQYL